MDTTLIYKTIEKYKSQVETYQNRIASQQSEILKDQAWIHKLKTDIAAIEDEMENKVKIIKDYQAKIFGAQEAIVALNEITE